MDLKVKYGKKYRVSLEESWEHDTAEGKLTEKWRYYEIRGKYGVIYPFGVSIPAVLISSPKIASKLASYVVKNLQKGDDETCFTFNPENFDKIAQSIKARKRRQISPEMLEKLSKRLAEMRAKKVIVDK